MKRIACGELVPGCTAVFTGETEEEVLTQAGEHAADHHRMEVTPAVVELVRQHIRDVPATGEAADR